MKQLCAVENRPKSIRKIHILLVLSAGVVCAFGGLLPAGYIAGNNSISAYNPISIRYSPYTLISNPGLNFTFDDEYTSESEIKRTHDAYNTSVGDASSSLIFRSLSETLTTSHNTFHYDTAFGFYPLRSPPLLS